MQSLAPAQDGCYARGCAARHASLSMDFFQFPDNTTQHKRLACSTCSRVKHIPSLQTCLQDLALFIIQAFMQP